MRRTRRCSDGLVAPGFRGGLGVPRPAWAIRGVPIGDRHASLRGGQGTGLFAVLAGRIQWWQTARAVADEPQVEVAGGVLAGQRALRDEQR